ncbi:MAG: hypothetical protein FJ403_11765 [Verrucomicrobia bacterium]|nr:hypothetical protein [Verrucomicrobiota bacterium]
MITPLTTQAHRSFPSIGNGINKRVDGTAGAVKERSTFHESFQRPSQGILRHSPQDALFILLALLLGAILTTQPSALPIGLGLWWNANTIAHNFIHLPFFRRRCWNRICPSAL